VELSKPKVKIDKASLRLVQLNFIAWLTLFLTLAISLRFGEIIPEVRTSDLFGTIMADGIIFTEIHFTILISTVIVIPIVYLTNRFYKTFLTQFVKVV